VNPPLAFALALHAFATLPEHPLAETRVALHREPTPAEVAMLVEALAFAQAASAAKKPALAEDAEFRRRALRNPWARARAMQVFNLAIEAAPPEIGALLHTLPGDNCPLCRRLAPDAGNGQ
jgi:hypothetical protein